MRKKKIAIVGGGFTGMSAAFDLAQNFDVTVIESDHQLGGLASTFDVNGVQLEKFYHHWFASDSAIMGLIDDLGLSERVQTRPTATGTYYANTHYRLSTPLDLLRFRALTLPARVRLGLQALHARTVKDWRALEHLTAEEWLRATGGNEVYDKVWAPLLKGKFGPYAPDVGAVWFWNKLKLRGGSRGRGGREELAYFEGGFGGLIDALAATLRDRGVRIETATRAQAVLSNGSRVAGLLTDKGTLECDCCVLTPALPIIADLLRGTKGVDDTGAFEAIPYLANVCLVLQLSRPLSDTYWLNVNDASFPFVGVIEHTNFVGNDTYGGSHLVYLSKYLPATDPLYSMPSSELLAFSVPHLKRMFPEFDPSWVVAHNTWNARYAQPVVGTHYSRNVERLQVNLDGCFLATMAQIYPEDRGTNYAVRSGRQVAREVVASFGESDRDVWEQGAFGERPRSIDGHLVNARRPASRMR